MNVRESPRKNLAVPGGISCNEPTHQSAEKGGDTHVAMGRESPSRLLPELVVELRLHLSRNRVGSLPLLLGHHLGSLLGRPKPRGFLSAKEEVSVRLKFS